MRRRNDSGFTLIELLVVMVIISVLAGIAVPVFLHQRSRAADTAIRSDLHAALTEMVTYSDTSYLTAPQLAAAGSTLRTSANSVVTVLSVTATDFCLAGTNSKGSKDTSGLAAAVGLQSKVFYATATSGVREATAQNPGCIATAGSINGYFDATGYHTGTPQF